MNKLAKITGFIVLLVIFLLGNTTSSWGMAEASKIEFKKVVVGNYGSGNGEFGHAKAYPPAPSAGPQGFTVDREENIYVVDTFNNRIQKFDRNGNFLMKFGEKGIRQERELEKGKFYNITDVAIGLNGNIIAGDLHRVLVFDRNGTFLFEFGYEEEGRHLGPRKVNTDNAGNIFVYSMPDTLFGLFKFDKTGHFIKRYGTSKIIDSKGNGYGFHTKNCLIRDPINKKPREYIDLGLKEFDREKDLLPGKYGFRVYRIEGQLIGIDKNDILYLILTWNDVKKSQLWKIKTDGTIISKTDIANLPEEGSSGPIENPWYLSEDGTIYYMTSQWEKMIIWRAIVK